MLQSGPMLGYSEMREVLLWVQTTEAAKVQFAYWPEGKPAQKQMTATYQTNKVEAYTAKLLADEVEPGMKYDYELLINDKVVSLPYATTFQTQELWQWRIDPPPFTMA
ncbi:MAG: alkaline phosphatase family protein, partial [Bacteroidota bacterium]